MHCFLFTDWITLRGVSGATPAITAITQGEEGWVDLDPYQDVIAWLDVREVTPPVAAGTLYVDFQTSPVLDEAYFTSLVNNSGGVALAAAGSPTVVRMTKDSTYTPLAKYMRWQVNTFGVTPTQTWDVTFRIWLAANFAMSTSFARVGAPGGCGCGGR